MEFTTEQANGHTYYHATKGQFSWTLRNYNGRWELWSKRLNIGNRFGTLRIFESLQEIEAKVKAFRGISQLIEA